MTKTDLNVFVPVNENWYPSFKIDYQGEILLVRVTLHETTLSFDPPFTRVSVWGADDCGMEKDYLATEFAQAKEDWLKVIQQKNLTRKWLNEQGFVNA